MHIAILAIVVILAAAEAWRVLAYAQARRASQASKWVDEELDFILGQKDFKTVGYEHVIDFDGIGNEKAETVRVILSAKA